MAEIKRRSLSRGEDEVEVVEEASCRGADGSTSAESVLSSIPAESPSFFTWMWIQILTACSRSESSEVLSRIAASKSTWSEVLGRDVHHSVKVPCPNDQLSDWEELMESNPSFFRDYPWLEIGRLIAEGGQAEIFEAKMPDWYLGDYVLKVFKADAGISLADLKRHWPRSMRKDGKDCSEFRSMQDRSSPFVFEDVDSNIGGDRCIIVAATWLQNGRFAFLMQRYWGDLRTLIDLKVQENTHSWKLNLFFRNRREQPPFSFRKSIWIMFQIARGMLNLHAQGVLHRDLKVANVLIRARNLDSLLCDVADYECAMFVQGTGFWRAPEVWQELQKKEEDRNGEIWTQKVDVYSFGMTCFEILIGQVPFDGCIKSKRGNVIKGKRPSLPNYVFLELRELVEACWHVQPCQRPSFEYIVGLLEYYVPLLGKKELGVKYLYFL